MSKETRAWLEQVTDNILGDFLDMSPDLGGTKWAGQTHEQIVKDLTAAYRKGLEDAAGRLLDEVERLKAERDRLARALDTIGRPAEHHGGAAHCEACADVAPALTLARRILSQDKEEKENETSKSEGDSK